MIKVVETKFEQIDGDDTRLAFIGDDNKKYDAEFTPAARAQLMLQFQVEIARRREQNHIPLTLTGSSVIASAAGFALGRSRQRKLAPLRFGFLGQQLKRCSGLLLNWRQ
jgi:hypothetical protein